MPRRGISPAGTSLSLLCTELKTGRARPCGSLPVYAGIAETKLKGLPNTKD
jgi:hypothetical protein